MQWDGHQIKQRTQSLIHICKTIDFVDWPQTSGIDLQEASRFSPKASPETLLWLQQYGTSLALKCIWLSLYPRAFLEHYPVQGWIGSWNYPFNWLFPDHGASAEGIQAEMAQDNTLQQLKETIISGWPDMKKEVPTCLHPYFLVSDELSVQDSLIFKDQHCDIPFSVHTKINHKMHKAHTWIQSCLSQARETMYWPGMYSDLTDHISKSDICSSYQSNQAREPLISHEFADLPWQKIEADVLTLDGTDHLCVVHYYSSYFKVPLRTKRTEILINNMLTTISTTYLSEAPGTHHNGERVERSKNKGWEGGRR